MKGRIGAKLGWVLIALVLGAVVAELGLRLGCRKSLGWTPDERTLTCRYDPLLGWSPQPNISTRIPGSRTISAMQNSRGFRGPEPANSGKPRAVFLGDSLVWGYGVEASERFTEKLQADHPKWDIQNLGVNGYGTDQEYILLQRQFDAYRPRLVFLIICGDDDNEDNSWNFRGGYYKPFFTLEGGRLTINGVPPPKSERTFFAAHQTLCGLYLVRLGARCYYAMFSPSPAKNPEPPTGALLLDMSKYAAAKGARFAVGLQHSNRQLEAFLQQFKIPYVELETTNPALVNKELGNHWTSAGHAFVAGKIGAFLETQLR